RASIMPDLPSRACIESPDFIRAGNVHDATNDNRCVLHLIDVGHWKNPLWGEPRNVGFVDLSERAVVIAADIAVVGGPILLRGYLAIAVLRELPQKVQVLVVR